MKKLQSKQRGRKGKNVSTIRIVKTFVLEKDMLSRRNIRTTMPLSTGQSESI